jgi:hypothetical protein
MDNNNVHLTRAFSNFTDYLINQYGNLPVDVKPRGGNAYNVQPEKGKGKGKSKGKGKNNKGKGKSNKRKWLRTWTFRLLGRRRCPGTQTPTHRPHLHDRVLQSPIHQVHGSNASSPLTSSDNNPDPKLYYYCHYHGWNLSHAGPECRVISNDSAYTRAQKKATSPTDTSLLVTRL